MGLGLKVLFAMVSVMPLLGQVVARQGTVLDLQQSEFKSPMVIELPMAKLKTGSPVDIYTFTDQDKFICDDVSLPLVVVRKTINEKKNRVELKIETTAYVRPSHDRRVTLHYSITCGGRTLTPKLYEQQISAKEKENRTGSISLAITKDEFDKLFQDGNHGVIRVVVSVESDR